MQRFVAGGFRGRSDQFHEQLAPVLALLTVQTLFRIVHEAENIVGLVNQKQRQVAGSTHLTSRYAEGFGSELSLLVRLEGRLERKQRAVGSHAHKTTNSPFFKVWIFHQAFAVREVYQGVEYHGAPPALMTWSRGGTVTTPVRISARKKRGRSRSPFPAASKSMS